MHTQQNFNLFTAHHLFALSKDELIELVLYCADYNKKLQEELALQQQHIQKLESNILAMRSEILQLRHKMYGNKSEKNKTSSTEPSAEKPAKKEPNNKPAGSDPKKSKVQQLSQRYPHAKIIKDHIELAEAPCCKGCQSTMQDSGMTEVSEYLTVIPKQFIIVQQERVKYRCTGCHGDIVTAPGPQRIQPGASYSDAMMIDVVVSKYCDLIPIERYAAMADRDGLKGLPTQSLIELTHVLADFLMSVYTMIKEEILNSTVLHADETPHRMLEGDERKTWYLWGFSTNTTSYFDIRNTRSGSVASELLHHSQCQFLITDLFSGYGKSIRDTNELRVIQNKPLIRNALCNAHARRKFIEAFKDFEDESNFFILKYQNIYNLERMASEKPPDEILNLRRQMVPIFESMQTKALELQNTVSNKSSLGKALQYFLENFEGFILFTTHSELKIDNNSQERLLRNPVIGRKTWYGTHSPRGAQTAAILFSMVESCKLNKVNPRQYFTQLVADLHAGKQPYTPRNFIPKK